jgi:hypothetical protein
MAVFISLYQDGKALKMRELEEEGEISWVFNA